MNFQQLLADYPRIAVAGAPRTGKTSITEQVSDRPVIHTDDWMDEPWEDVPRHVAAACAGLSSFVVEGVRAPDALRKGGLEVDVVVWLSRPKVVQTPMQKGMGPGIHTVLTQWAEKHPEIPIVTEETLTLDHAELPAKTRRYATWTLDASGIERTPQGGLRIPARASKAGVFKYQRGARVLREYRPASELRKPAALASIKGAPVVVLHPDIKDNGGAVDTENFTELTVGHFEDPFFNEETQAIEGWVVTNDADTIKRIASGELADISCAYDNGRDFNPGFTPERVPFDLTQIDFIFNHVALGPPGWGRQGTDVGLLTLDANDNQVVQQPPNSEEAMLPKKTDDKTPKTQDADDKPAVVPPAAEDKPTKDEALELTADDIAAFKRVCAMLPELNKLINTGSGGAAPPPPPAPPATMEGGAEYPTADGKEAKTMDAADVERIAQEGVEVRTEAIAVLGEKYSPRGKSTRQVRVDVIRTFDSKFSDDGKTDDAVTAAYSIALIAGQERNKNAAELGRTRRHGTVTLDGQEQEPTKAIGHQAYDAWKN